MSNRITKSLAEELAEMLTKKKRDEIEALQIQFGTVAMKDCEAKIPKPVLAFAKNFPNWARTINYLTLVGNGFNWRRAEFPEGCRLPEHNDDQSRFIPSDKAAKELSKIENQISDKTKKLKELWHDVYNAVLQLKTDVKVIEQFPETETLLTAHFKKDLLPAVNFKSIKTRLKS